jgi:hypothetical protein
MLQVRDPGGILSFTPDKGEADGSNPSGPTSVFPGQKPFSAVRDTRPKGSFLKAVSKFRRLDPDQIGLPAGVSRSHSQSHHADLLPEQGSRHVFGARVHGQMMS